MNDQWNLDRLYMGFDDPEYEKDFARFQALVTEFSDLTGKLDAMAPVEALRTGIRLREEMAVLGSKLSGYSRLLSAADAKDREANSQSGRIMNISSNTAGPMAAFNQWACDLEDLMELVRGDDFLRNYEFLFAGMLEAKRYRLGVEATQVAAKMRLSGGNAWSKMHGYLTSTVPVTYRGKTINLSAVRNLARDPDPEVRREAYEAELACYGAIADPCAHALNAIKLETLSNCKLRGYESPLDMTLKDADMKRQTLEAMLSAMDEYLPKFWQYLRAKGKLLGHENGLPWYELFAPVGKESPAMTIAEARQFLLDQFSKFDSDLADMARRAFDEGWIDFWPRDGKRGGAFCSSILALGESRILTNFDGSSAAVTTLAHELGHAFHNLCLASHRPLNHGYSMPLAGTASTFNGCVDLRYLLPLSV